MDNTARQYRITRGGIEKAVLGYGEFQQHSLQTAARHWCLLIGGHLAQFQQSGIFACADDQGQQKGYSVQEVRE